MPDVRLPRPVFTRRTERTLLWTACALPTAERAARELLDAGRGGGVLALPALGVEVRLTEAERGRLDYAGVVGGPGMDTARVLDALYLGGSSPR